MSQPVRVPKAAALVAASLRRRIVSGELEEGDALPNETELMQFYEVSRPTLREALRVLESESLIAVKRGARGGARVAHPDPLVTARHAATLLRMQGTSLADVFAARQIIEPAAVELLAERCRENPALLEPLWVAHEQSKHVQSDPIASAQVAAEFHKLVIELAGNQTLSLIALIMQEIVQPNNEATLTAMHEHEKGAVLHRAEDDHAELLRMLESGTGDPAALWRRHMEGAGRTALAALGDEAKINVYDGEMNGA